MTPAKRALRCLRMQGAIAFASAFVVAFIGCGDPEYAEAPFACSTSDACPDGYRCSARLCIEEDAADLPLLLDESSGPFDMVMHEDRDRDGTVICWTSVEDRLSARGSIRGALVSKEGVVRPLGKLVELDTRGVDFYGTCAPVPGSDGKLLVSLWLQAAGTLETRLMVWEPREALGYQGSARTLLSKVSGSTTLLLFIESASRVVGNETWTITEEVNYRGYLIYYRLRVDAESLETARLKTEVLIPGVLGSEDQHVLRNFIMPMEDGSRTWLVFDESPVKIGLLPMEGSLTFPTDRAPSPTAVRGYGKPLASRGQELASLWNDPGEDAGSATSFRIRWFDQSFAIRIGPRLPFTRFETPRPGGMKIGDDLYVVGAPTVSRGGGSVDAGASASSLQSGALNVYRIPWGADDATSLESIVTLDRGVRSEIPVNAVEVVPVRDDPKRFVAAWVEFEPTTSLRGARYRLYGSGYALP